MNISPFEISFRLKSLREKSALINCSSTRELQTKLAVRDTTILIRESHETSQTTKNFHRPREAVFSARFLLKMRSQVYELRYDRENCSRYLS